MSCATPSWPTPAASASASTADSHSLRPLAPRAWRSLGPRRLAVDRPRRRLGAGELPNREGVAGGKRLRKRLVQLGVELPARPSSGGVLAADSAGHGTPRFPLGCATWVAATST